MTYSIQVTNDNGKIVKAFSFDVDETTAYDMLSETAERYPGDHVLDLQHLGRTVTDGRCHGSKPR
jgi:hypothetical protein